MPREQQCGSNGEQRAFRAALEPTTIVMPFVDLASANAPSPRGQFSDLVDAANRHAVLMAKVARIRHEQELHNARPAECDSESLAPTIDDDHRTFDDNATIPDYAHTASASTIDDAATELGYSMDVDEADDDEADVTTSRLLAEFRSAPLGELAGLLAEVEDLNEIEDDDGHGASSRAHVATIAALLLLLPPLSTALANATILGVCSHAVCSAAVPAHRPRAPRRAPRRPRGAPSSH